MFMPSYTHLKTKLNKNGMQLNLESRLINVTQYIRKQQDKCLKFKKEEERLNNNLYWSN